MKNSKLIKLVLFLPFLLLSFKASAVMSPLHGNWLNYMTNGLPESLANDRVYIFLDQEEGLHINLVVTTTDHNVSEYDPLYLTWEFHVIDYGTITGSYGPVKSSDLEPVGGELFEYSHPINLNFLEECGIDADGTMGVSINFALKTPKFGGILDDYPLASNQGLFHPSQYVDYTPGFSTDKMLLCWGNEPPSLFVSNDNQNKITSNSNRQANEQSLEINGSFSNNENKTEELSIYPNPFTNQIHVEYKLELPSEVEIQVSDLNGNQIAYQKQFVKSTGINKQTFDFKDEVPPGIYIVQVNYLDKIETGKLIKLKAAK